MLARPLMVVPVFMKAWAGSWLIWLGVHRAHDANSSAIPAMCGNKSEISWPDSHVLEFDERAACLQFCVLQLVQAAGLS